MTRIALWPLSILAAALLLTSAPAGAADKAKVKTKVPTFKTHYASPDVVKKRQKAKVPTYKTHYASPDMVKKDR